MDGWTDGMDGRSIHATDSARPSFPKMADEWEK